MSTLQACSRLVLIVLLFATVSCSEDTTAPDTTPPSVSISQPTEGIVVSGEVPIVVNAEDKGGISKVQYFVDDVMIAEDLEEPFEQIWYSGFWEGGIEYSIRAVAYDADGNSGESDPVRVSLQADSKYVPAFDYPEEDHVFSSIYIDYMWSPVPGARWYTLKIRIPGYELDYDLCDDETEDACYVWVTDLSYSERLPFYKAFPLGTYTIEAFISLRAYWTVYNKSEWSEERRIIVYLDNSN